MASPVSAFHALLWFLREAIEAGLGNVYFAVALITLAAALVFTFPRDGAFARRRLIAPLVILPAIWLFVGYWGGLFWRSRDPALHYGDWVQYPGMVGPFLLVLVAAFFIWRLDGARLFVGTYALINLYFTAALSFMSLMAVTGDWL